MSTPSEKDTELLIFCDCGMPTDIIPAQGYRYRRHTMCHKRKCKHFQWVDDRLTRDDKISIMKLQAENRSLRADLLTTKATLRRYMDAEMGVKLLLNDVRHPHSYPDVTCSLSRVIPSPTLGHAVVVMGLEYTYFLCSGRLGVTTSHCLASAYVVKQRNARIKAILFT
ncbi:hypothetical protein Cgig2_017465 [Carnegiea gigantea]|uniref:Uncharacterized protein n=1 Tax=Carnegiea gigantea TaxID=171969 RepID=A0A9Q1GXN9_9CARY|nr:hypothetical protein Cgig2_017465 [Carnegiea gigantea]